MPKRRCGTKMSAETSASRTRDPQGRRQNIIDAAAKLFAQKGVSATSIRDIAQLSGENLSTVYYYFNDKEDLFVTVMMETTLRAIAPVLKAEKDRRGDVLTRLRRLLAAYLDFAVGNPESSMMVIRGLLRLLEHESTPFMQVMAQRFAAIQEMVREGRERGEIKKIPDDLFAFSLIGQVLVFFFANLVADSVEDWPFRAFGEKEFLDFTAATLLEGIRA